MKKKNKYYYDREQQRMQARELADKNTEQYLKGLFNSSNDNINNLIYKLFSNYANKENITIEEAKKRASQFDVKSFADKAKLYVETKDFSKQANEELRLYNLKMKVSRLQLIQQEMRLELVNLYNELEKQILNDINETVMQEIREQAGILGVNVPFSKNELLEIASIGFVEGNFSSNIWKNMNALHKELSNLIKKSLILGTNPNEIAKELAKKFNVEFGKAKRIAITEKTNAQMYIKQKAFEQAGFEYFKIIPETTACKVCKKKADKVYKVEDLAIGVNTPSFHPNCKCSIVPYVR